MVSRVSLWLSTRAWVAFAWYSIVYSFIISSTVISYACITLCLATNQAIRCIAYHAQVFINARQNKCSWIMNVVPHISSIILLHKCPIIGHRLHVFRLPSRICPVIMFITAAAVIIAIAVVLFSKSMRSAMLGLLRRHFLHYIGLHSRELDRLYQDGWQYCMWPLNIVSYIWITMTR